jgi:geranylgeranyl pyrophosphate synthase
MGLTAYRAQLKARIDGELKLRLGEWFPGLPDANQEALHDMLAEGKRLRGSLTCLVAEALGASLERALPSALAVEMIQAASLVHDDFVDGDTVRRGRPAAWTRLPPRRAVLLADLVFATAIEKMAKAGGREGATLAHAIATMAQGAVQETLDPAYAKRAGRDAYRRIIYLKTGSLFAAAARLGALAAGADERTLEAATEFGARTGEAYQVADDLADDMEAAPAVRRRMGEEIVLLIEQARRALVAFPDNESTRMLAEMPGLISAPIRWPIRTP